MDNSYLDIVKKGLKIAKNSGAKAIYWVSPMFSLDQDVENRHYFTHMLLKNKLPLYGVKYINVRDLSKTGHQSDNVHFQNSKYKEMANYIFKKLPKVFVFPSTIKPILLGGIGYFIFKLINK